MTGPATDAVPPGSNPSGPPPTGTGGGGPAGARSNPPPTHVSESAYEFLLGEILHWVEMECSVDRLQAQQQAAQQQQQQQQQAQQGGGDEANPAEGAGGGGGDDPSDDDAPDSAAKQQQAPPPPPGPSREELAILSAERAAAKIERLGFDVGYRLCERLAQSKPLGPGLPPPGPGQKAGDGAGGGGAVDPSSVQLEAVKFLCKEFWTEVFRKQIDKLQTNHRGVFVLKDHELRWLRRLPPEDETARVAAIKMLAFPCGLIRGALSNLGIAAVVSCDFLADGKNMAACSFNIKIKA